MKCPRSGFYYALVGRSVDAVEVLPDSSCEDYDGVIRVLVRDTRYRSVIFHVPAKNFLQRISAAQAAAWLVGVDPPASVIRKAKRLLAR
jgi:hypothetical protein